MTTDMVGYRQTDRTGATAGAGAFRSLFAACPRADRPDSAFTSLSGNEEIRKLLGLLEHSELEKDGHERCMGAAVALLKYAHKIIERAESVVLVQESRIAKLEALATTDELTGLKNRRGFYEIFNAELDKCSRGLSRGGLLVLVDLDNFSAVNGTYGHMAGDACLRLVAGALESGIRAMDAAARLGGDEFVLLLSNTSKESAASRAQDLAWQLGQLSVAWHGDEIPVRASLALRPYKAGDRPEKIFGAPGRTAVRQPRPQPEERNEEQEPQEAPVLRAVRPRS